MLLQDVTAAAGDPSISEWRAILILVGGATAALFGALTLTWKGRSEDQAATIARMEAQRKEEEAAHERALQAERDCTVRAEKTADDAVSRLGAQTAVMAEQSAAVREFGLIVREVASESRRISERLDTVVRTTEDLRRTIGDSWTRRPSTHATREPEHNG